MSSPGHLTIQSLRESHVSAVEHVSDRFGRLQRISLALALAWAIVLVVAAFAVPVYQSEGLSSSGTVASGSATLVGVNGWGVLLVAGAPLAAAVVAGSALWRRAARHSAGIVAWTVTGVTGLGVR